MRIRIRISFDADPDRLPKIMRIQIRLFNLMRIRIFTLMRIRIGFQKLCGPGSATHCFDHSLLGLTGDEAVHEQADALRAPRDIQLPADLLHWRQCQETTRDYWRAQQLRL